MQRTVSTCAIPAEALASMADSGESEMRVTFDNKADSESTTITVEGFDRRNLLVALSGAFSSTGLEIVSANISSEDGKVMDVFKVQIAGKQVR